MMKRPAGVSVPSSRELILREARKETNSASAISLVLLDLLPRTVEALAMLASVHVSWNQQVPLEFGITSH